MSGRLRLDARLLILIGLATGFYAAYTQRLPYHIDTVGFLVSAKEALATGTPPSNLALRFLTIWDYLPFVRVFGDAGVPVASVFHLVAFVAFYYIVLRREWGGSVAFAGSLLFLSVPATVITVTHLKEDFVALSLVMAALWLLHPRPRIWRAAVGGALLGLACLGKEQTLILTPFVAAHLALAVAPPARFRDLARLEWLKRAALPVIALLAAGLLVLLSLSPRFFAQIAALGSSSHTGQFLGVGSVMQWQGADLWHEGMLYLAFPHLVLPPVAIWAVRRRAFAALLWLAAGLGTFLFLSNISVVQSRLFVLSALFSAPLIALGIDRVAGAVFRRPAARPIAAATVHAVAALGVALQVAYLLPTLEYRKAYPPQAEYYGRLRAALPGNALLVGMDDCVLARYYTRCPCLVAPVDPGEATAGAFAAALAETARARPVYALADLYSYDRHRGLERAIGGAFGLEQAFVELGEDYHVMTFATRMRDVLGALEERGCTVVATEKAPLVLNRSLTVQLSHRRLRCLSGESVLNAAEYRGVRTHLGHRAVTRLVPASPRIE